MRFSKSILFVFAGLLSIASAVDAQETPKIGYMIPAGGQPGETIDVVLGGYDWTPDVEIFVHDSRIKLELTGPPGPVIVPEPPYWFGKKARRSPFLLPRETPARLTIPAGVEPGLVKWQVANANGGSAVGTFAVRATLHVAEIDGRSEPQLLPQIPVTVSAQIKHIAEVDEYRFVTENAGLVNVTVAAPSLGSQLTAVLEVREANGRMVADIADTSADDATLTFAAAAKGEYIVRVYDADFRGNRAFVYQLIIQPGPRVLAAIPASGKRGETKPVEFVGYGIASGKLQLESVTKEVSFPADASKSQFDYTLSTAYGSANQISLETTEHSGSIEPKSPDVAGRKLTIPAVVSGVLEEKYGTDRYLLAGTKGEKWSISVEGKRLGRNLDPALTIVDAEGKMLVQNDDATGTSMAALDFTVPADGEYEVRVSDVSGNSGDRSAVYLLKVEPQQSRLVIELPQVLNVPIGGKLPVTVKATRIGGWTETITLKFEDLPAGITLPEEVTIPTKRPSARIDFSCAEDVAAVASFAKITATAVIGSELKIKEGDPKPELVNVSHQVGQVLVVTTIPPPFVVNAEGKDDVTKWPRGTTFPAPVLVERNEGFTADIVLEMASKQGRHRQGIKGPELTIPNGPARVLYPVFLPEWLETTRTSRIILNGVAKVKDPKGNIRHSVSRLKTRIGFLPTGAYLKIEAGLDEIDSVPGEQIVVPISISRAKELREPATLELIVDGDVAETITADQMVVAPGENEVVFTVFTKAGEKLVGKKRITIRATVMQNGKYPVVSETTVPVYFPAGK